MRIFGVLPASWVNGDGCRFVVFVQGCAHHCAGCHKQDAELAEYERQTALARAETDKVKAETHAAIELIEAEAEAKRTIIEAQAEAEANKTVAASITENLISMKEAEARMEHGWVTVQGANTVVAN